MMPKGVEHKSTKLVIERAVKVQLSVMPKGVEHTATAEDDQVLRGATISDAERR